MPSTRRSTTPDTDSTAAHRISTDAPVCFEHASLRPRIKAVVATAPPLLAALVDAADGGRRCEMLAAQVREIGFEDLVYARFAMVQAKSEPTAMCICCGTGNWVRAYLAHGLHAADPRLQEALRSTLPFRWSLGSVRAGLALRSHELGAARLLNTIVESGQRHGIVLALPGPGTNECSVVMLGTRLEPARGETEDLAARVLMISMCLHEFHCRHVDWPLDDQRAAPLRPSLSERQEQILQCLARGLTDREIAEALNLSMHGVDYHLRRLRQLFLAHNRVELLQAAFRARSI